MVIEIASNGHTDLELGLLYWGTGKNFFTYKNSYVLLGRKYSESFCCSGVPMCVEGYTWKPVAKALLFYNEHDVKLFRMLKEHCREKKSEQQSLGRVGEQTGKGQERTFWDC